jgi:hypothetical protein
VNVRKHCRVGCCGCCTHAYRIDENEVVRCEVILVIVLTQKVRDSSRVVGIVQWALCRRCDGRRSAIAGFSARPFNGSLCMG